MPIFKNRVDRRVLQLTEDAEEAHRTGDTAKSLQHISEAADLLVQENRLKDALDLCVSHRSYSRAARLAEQIGDHDQAAQLWFRAGDYFRSAEQQVIRGDLVVAADLFERVQEYRRAAELTLDLGDSVRASMLFERAGNKERAADVLVEALSGQRYSVRHSEQSQAFLKAGTLCAEVGRFNEAVRLFLAGGHAQAGAECLVRNERPDEAIEVLATSGDLLAAAEMARSKGDEQRACVLLGRRSEDEGRLAVAASHAEQAGDLARSALLYDFAGDKVRAATAYELAQQFDTAAYIWERLGRVEDAQRCLIAAGSMEEAAALTRRADGAVIEACRARGDDLGAGAGLILRARRGDRISYVEAEDCLRRCTKEHKDYRTAQSLLADVLAERGERRGAIDILRGLLDGIEIDHSVCPILYQYGRLLEAEGYIAGARSTYQRLVSVSPRFRDSAARLRYYAERHPVLPLQAPIRTVIGRPGSSTPRSPPNAAAAAVLGAAGLRQDSNTEDEEVTEQVTIPITGVKVSHRLDEPTDELAAIDLSAIHYDPEETVMEMRIAMPPSLKGVVLRGRFKIEKEIGRGGQAKVYLASDLVLDRPVAIKVLSQASGEGLERFLQEARVSARVRHAGCVSLFDFGEERGLTFMAQEYVEGKSLEELLVSGSIEVAESVRITRAVADALGAVHAVGVVHRDVKPGNILLDRENRVRLTDFGVAGILEGEVAQDRMIGTPRYMSPEQANSDPIDARSDLFSLGVVMYEMLSGKPPFDDSLGSLAVRLVEPAPPLPEQPWIPRAIRAMVSRCLEIEPKDRYQTTEELIADLDAAGNLVNALERTADG